MCPVNSMSVECLCDDSNFQIILKHEKLTLEIGAFVHGSRGMGWGYQHACLSAKVYSFKLTLDAKVAFTLLCLCQSIVF